MATKDLKASALLAHESEMEKLSHYKKKIEFELNENSIDALSALPDEVLNEVGLFRSGENGFTLGRRLDPHESEGAGLPPARETDLFSQDYHIYLDARLSIGENRTVELRIARRGAGTHFTFPLTGLTDGQLYDFLKDRDYDLSMGSVALDAIYYLVWACYRRQDDLEGRKNAYEKIIKNQKNRFKQLLGSPRYKEIIESEDNGVKVSKCVPIESGRNPQTEAEIEKEKEMFILDFQRIATNLRATGRKPTKANVQIDLFPANADKEAAMKRVLRKYNLKFRDLVKRGA